jgi:transcription elongation factor GreA
MSERNVIYVTEEGLQKIKDELEHLSTVKREELAERLRRAIVEGDLRENADYAYAKQEQSFIEGRIRELQDQLRYVQIIPEGGSTNQVRVGSTVTIVDTEFDEEETYRIVGVTEADPLNGLISNESPIGRALLGKKKGAKIDVETPNGIVTFKLTDIS